jgi:hypothetical protein
MKHCMLTSLVLFLTLLFTDKTDAQGYLSGASPRISSYAPRVAPHQAVTIVNQPMNPINYGRVWNAENGNGVMPSAINPNVYYITSNPRYLSYVNSNNPNINLSQFVSPADVVEPIIEGVIF